MSPSGNQPQSTPTAEAPAHAGPGQRVADRGLSSWTLIIVILAVCLAIGSPLIGLRVFHPSDLLLSFDPWKSETSEIVTPSHILLWDTVDAVMPQRAEASRRALGGDFPLWDPLPSGGSPLAARPEGLLGPLNLPFLLVPLWFAPAVSKLLEVVVAAGFTFLFLRRIGLMRPPAIMGGLLFAFSGFQVMWTNWPQAHVAAFIPGLFWSIEYGIGRRSARGVMPLALIVAAMLFEGYPPLAGMALAAGAVYGLVRVLWLRDSSPGLKTRTAALLIGGATLGVALTAFQLVPFLEQLGRFDLSYRQQTAGSHLPLHTAVTLGVPYAFGTLAHGGLYFGPSNEVGIQSFFGITGLVLIAAGAALGRVRVGRGTLPYLWTGTVVVVLAIFIGGPVLATLQLIPIFDLTYIDRLRAVLGFVLACLAAVGAQALLVDRGKPIPTGGPRRAATVAIALCLGVLGAVVLYRSAREANQQGYVLRQSFVPLMALSAAGGLLLRRRLRSLLLWSIPVLVAIEVLAFTLPAWPRIPREQFYPTTTVHRFLAENLGHDRLVPEGRTFFPGSSPFYGLRSVTGHVFYDDGWKQLLLAVDPRSFDPSPTHPALSWRSDIASSPILDRLSARYFVVSPAAPILGESAPLATPIHTRTLQPGATITREMAVTSPRGLILHVARPPRNPDRFTALTVEFLDAGGGVIARGWRRLFPESLGPVEIAVAGSVTGREASTVRIRLSPGGDPIDVGADEQGDADLSAIREQDDGLRVAHVGGAVVYERLDWLPRIRWASEVEVVTDPGERIEILAKGTPSHSVILNSTGPPASGQPALVRPLEDEGDVIRVAVEAEGAGYLVVADALQHGWHAELDGHPVPLLPADHALAAVAVPGGSHVVELRYRPEGLRLGLIVSAAALLLLLAALALGARQGARAPSAGQPR
ncbi:MAG: YfhO family protein [Actinomycetota bacterium]